MKPLQEWICDTCGEIIRSPEEGWVEWLRDDDGRVGDFRICHGPAFSPLAKGQVGSAYCQEYRLSPDVQDLSLDRFVGPRGLIEMLSYVDVGERLQENYSGPRVRDFRNWTETCRRLFLPYYEEARLYWGEATAAGFCADANEIYTYLPETLKELIALYGPQEN